MFRKVSWPAKHLSKKIRKRRRCAGSVVRLSNWLPIRVMSPRLRPRRSQVPRKGFFSSQHSANSPRKYMYSDASLVDSFMVKSVAVRKSMELDVE